VFICVCMCRNIVCERGVNVVRNNVSFEKGKLWYRRKRKVAKREKVREKKNREWENEIEREREREREGGRGPEAVADDIVDCHIRTQGTPIVHIAGLPKRRIRSADVMVIAWQHDGSCHATRANGLIEFCGDRSPAVAVSV
jgi:hypothetical protein